MNIEDSLRRFMTRFQALDKSTVDVPTLNDGIIELKLISYQKGSEYVGYLPSYFFSIRQAKDTRIEVGRCDLRVGMSPEIPYAGHIGYRVWVSQRGRGYAGKASRLLMAFAHQLGMEEVLITCDPDNIPSRRTLEKLNGRFDGVVAVPESSPCFEAGDREKCQFWYQTKDFLDAPRSASFPYDD